MVGRGSDGGRLLMDVTMRGPGRTVKPRLLAGPQNDIVRENHGYGALGRVFRGLVRMMPPPCCHPGPIAFDRRKALRFRRLEGSEDVRRSFVRIESWVIHDVLDPPFNKQAARVNYSVRLNYSHPLNNIPCAAR